MLDLFCGTGGISFGLTQADPRFRTIGGVDLDPVASATARLNHPSAEILTAPIDEVDPAGFRAVAPTGRVDLIVGGPPCQGFSSLRPSRGEAIEDPRNSLPGYTGYGCAFRFVVAAQWNPGVNTLVNQIAVARIETA